MARPIEAGRKTFLKTALAGVLALGTLGGTVGLAEAGSFSFSWATPQGTYYIGPSHPNGHWVPRQVRPHVVQPYQALVRPREARRILRRAGFRDITFIRERRDVYVFEARGNRGYRRVAVDKHTGQIIWRVGHR